MNNLDKLKLFHIPEPRLTFGYRQRLADPRDGLTLFGPFDREKLTGQLNIGVIGPSEQREGIKAYLHSIHRPVVSQETDIARPYFPGLETTFGIVVNFANLKEIDIPRSDIDSCLQYSDPHQRIHRFCNLYSNKLVSYHKEEEMPVTVWFVAIPDQIYQFGRPRSKIPAAKTNVRARLTTYERHSGQTFLLEELTQLTSAYDFVANFHNQLKARLLSDKIVTQVIRDSTIRYHEIWDDKTRIETERKFDTAKAWNIATTLYYKAGGLPWKLGEVREGVCFLGLVYKKLIEDETDRNACCAAQMFLDSGDGVVFRGNLGPWYNHKTKEFHIGRLDARDLLSRSLEAFKERSGIDRYPSEVFIHAKTYFDDDEWSGFKEAAEGKSSLIGVRIRDDVPIKLYREFAYCVPRGAVLKISSVKGPPMDKRIYSAPANSIGT